MSGTWASGWVTGDVVTAAEFRKSVGCISDTTLGIATASIDITSIVATYAHLRVVCYLRGDTAATSVGVTVRFNADSGANYDSQGLAGGAATASAGETFAGTSIATPTQPAASAPASVFGLLIIDLPNYANTVGNKVAFLTVADKRGTASGNLVTRADVGFWRSSAAISRVTVAPSAGNWVASSRLSIYAMGS